MIWGVAALFYAFQYILRIIPNIMMADLQAYYQVSSKAFGQFAGVYYIGYALAHIPLGLLFDRKGPRYVLTFCILLTVLGLYTFVASKSFTLALFGRFLIGVGSSGAILGAFKIIRMGFPENAFNRMLGFCVMVGLLGAMYGGLPIKHFLSIMPWQDVIYLLMIKGVVVAGLSWALIPTTKNIKPVGDNILKDISQVLSNKKIVLLCICAGLMVGPLEGFADVWGVTFFERVYGFQGVTAAGLTSLIFLGMCFGSPIISIISDYFRAYYSIIYIAAVFMAVVFIVMICRLGNEFLMGSMMVGVGIFCAYQIIVIYLVTTMVRERLIGVATALTNMIIMLFGYIFHTLIGIVANDTTHNIITSNSIKIAMGIIPLALVLACVGLFFVIPKTKNKSSVAD